MIIVYFVNVLYKYLPNKEFQIIDLSLKDTDIFNNLKLKTLPNIYFY